MVEVIWERRLEQMKAEQKLRLREYELVVKHLAIANAVASQSKKQTKWLEGFVRKLDFVKLVLEPDPEEEEDNLPKMSQVMAAFGAGADGQIGKRTL